MSQDESTPQEEYELSHEEKVAEILKVALFEGYFTTPNGIRCRCHCHDMHHFHGELPHTLVNKDIENLDLSDIEGREFIAASICPCQTSHFYIVKCLEGILNFEYTEKGEEMSRRKIRIPGR